MLKYKIKKSKGNFNEETPILGRRQLFLGKKGNENREFY